MKKSYYESVFALLSGLLVGLGVGFFLTTWITIDRLSVLNPELIVRSNTVYGDTGILAILSIGIGVISAVIAVHLIRQEHKKIG
jgi:hypothetical protein